MASGRYWLQDAIKRPGALTKKAKAAGMTLSEYIRHVLRKGSRASTRTKRQALLAIRLREFARRRRKKKRAA